MKKQKSGSSVKPRARKTKGRDERLAEVLEEHLMPFLRKQGYKGLNVSLQMSYSKDQKKVLTAVIIQINRGKSQRKALEELVKEFGERLQPFVQT